MLHNQVVGWNPCRDVWHEWIFLKEISGKLRLSYGVRAQSDASDGELAALLEKTENIRGGCGGKHEVQLSRSSNL